MQMIVSFARVSSLGSPDLRNAAGRDPQTEPGEGPCRTSGCRRGTRGNSHQCAG